MRNPNTEPTHIERWRDERNERMIRAIIGPPMPPPREILRRIPPLPWQKCPLAHDVSGYVATVHPAALF